MGLDSQIFRGKAGVAFNTKFTFMTAGTELGIGAGSNGMSNVKVRAVDIDHVISQFTHLVGKAGFVTIQAV